MCTNVLGRILEVDLLRDRPRRRAVALDGALASLAEADRDGAVLGGSVGHRPHPGILGVFAGLEEAAALAVDRGGARHEAHAFRVGGDGVVGEQLVDGGLRGLDAVRLDVRPLGATLGTLPRRHTSRV